jgi:hypothetical protein
MQGALAALQRKMQSHVLGRATMSGWPELNAERDHGTLAVLHLASQMLGKIRVAHAPWVNHGWHVALQPKPNGFETLPTASGDGRTFTLRLDLCRHSIVLWVSDESRDELPLELGSIAAIHAGLIAMLDRRDLPSSFNGTPSEIENAVPFAEDIAPRAYTRDSANRLRGAFAEMMPVFERFRAGFIGKSSPVQMWWGGFDLAVTRFSGRPAPPHPGGIPGLPDRITREAYSQEVSSAGFWAGGVVAAEPFFYSYAYPEPDGYRSSRVDHGSYNDTYREFVLPYADVRKASDPHETLRLFLQSTYDAAADLAGWDRKALERLPAPP